MLLNILLIEDNESDVVMMKFLVKQQGHNLDDGDPWIMKGY